MYQWIAAFSFRIRLRSRGSLSKGTQWPKLHFEDHHWWLELSVHCKPNSSLYSGRACSVQPGMLVVFFNICRLKHCELAPPRHIAKYYFDDLRCVRQNSGPEWPKMWWDGNWTLQHDSVPAQSMLETCKFPAYSNTVVTSHTPYLPDLTPCDFRLLSQIKFGPCELADANTYSWKILVVLATCTLLYRALFVCSRNTLYEDYICIKWRRYLIDDFSVKRPVKDTRLLFHSDFAWQRHISLADGGARYFDHAWLRLHSLHLC